jgi:hypothetical protein
MVAFGVEEGEVVGLRDAEDSRLRIESAGRHAVG